MLTSSWSVDDVISVLEGMQKMCRKNPGIWSPCRNFKSTINEKLTLKDAINDVDEIMYLVKQQLTITISKKKFCQNNKYRYINIKQNIFSRFIA